MSENMNLWNALGTTDPKQTKGFKRSGGFAGTAIKPQWVWSRLTERFGPMGKGWGCDKPEFQVVPGAGHEVLVYCTVSAWHGDRSNVLWGVGGDKVVGTIKDRPQNDDEAFKKSYTDALMNAFKFVGVAADVHMGMFEDCKYVDKAAQEFEEKEEAPKLDGDNRKKITAMFDRAVDKDQADKALTYYQERIPEPYHAELREIYHDAITRIGALPPAEQNPFDGAQS